MSIWDYSKGGLGMIPGTIIYVYLGTAISDISDVVSGNTDGSSLHLALIIVGTVVSLLSIIYVSYVARNQLSKVIENIESSYNLNSTFRSSAKGYKRYYRSTVDLRSQIIVDWDDSFNRSI